MSFDVFSQQKGTIGLFFFVEIQTPYEGRLFPQPTPRLLWCAVDRVRTFDKEGHGETLPIIIQDGPLVVFK